MTATLVDTNILLDLLTDDPVWYGWSVDKLDKAAGMGRVAINDVVYAELSVRFDQIEPLDFFLTRMSVEIAPMPRFGLFLAGRAFQLYKRAGGTRTGVLRDFMIGAQAAASGWSLLTRDPRRYRTYFPSLALVTP